MLGASEAWIVLKTSTPVRAARMPMWAVSSSRISPIMITSGSWRSIALRPVAEAQVDLGCRPAIWLTPGIRRSIGSSIVITLRVGELTRLRQV